MRKILQSIGIFSADNHGLRNAVDLSFCYAKFTPEGQLLDCNENFAHLFKYKYPEEIIGNHHQMFVDKSYQESSAYKRFWKDLAEGKTQSGEFHRKNKEGENIYIQAAYTPMTDVSGKVKHVIKIASDITADKEVAIKAESIRNTIDLSFAYIQFDPKGNIMEANDNFIKVMGYQQTEEVVGRHHSIFVKESVRNSPSYQRFWEELRKGKVQSGEFHRIDKQGNDIWLQASYSPVKDNNGNVTAVVKIATDITEKKHSMDEAAVLKKTIDLSFGFIQFDQNGVIQDVNQNFVQLMGYSTRNEVIGKHHSVFVDPQFAASEDYLNFWKSLREGVTQKDEFERFRKDGQKVWIQAAYTPILDENGKVKAIVKIAADVTRAKQDAIQAKYELQKEVSGNVTEIAVAIEQIASGARTQADRTDESSEKMEKALESSTEVSAKAESISEAAATGASNSAEGTKIVARMVESMNALVEVSASTQESMKLLTRRTKEIGTALSAIQEIASQTNLLALNASIEAAQAGDAGRGFGVIAGEVRDLAEKSKRSANEIQDLITAIHKDTAEVGRAMNTMSESVKQGGEESVQVNDIFNKMSESSSNTSDLSGAILTAAINQKSEIKGMLQNIESIVVISNQTASGADEVLAAARSLENRIDSF